MGKSNSNGLLLLSKCAEDNLCITNTMFRFTKKYKTTWMLPKSEHWDLFDYIRVCHCNHKDVTFTLKNFQLKKKMLPLPEPCKVLSAGEITD